MKSLVCFSMAGLLLASVAAFAESGKEAPGKRDKNWGEVTRDSIKGGFAQGAHASDPSDDGHGPGTADEPRAGLANAGGKKGDLSNTMDALGL